MTTELMLQVIKDAKEVLHVAYPYALAIGMIDTPENEMSFVLVNEAIVRRWSKTALKRIKETAWAIAESRDALASIGE